MAATVVLDGIALIPLPTLKKETDETRLAAPGTFHDGRDSDPGFLVLRIGRGRATTSPGTDSNQYSDVAGASSLSPRDRGQPGIAPVTDTRAGRRSPCA